jgi:hypothetical protein
MKNNYIRQSSAVIGAVAGCLELYNIFQTVLSCSFDIDSPEGKSLSLWLCLFFGIGFRFPSGYGLYYHNTLFKSASVNSELFLLRLEEEGKKKEFSYTELTVDFLSAVSEGGLTFNSVFSLFTDCENYCWPIFLKYTVSAFFAISTTLSIFGVNRENSFIDCFVQSKKTVSYGTFFYISGGKILFLMLALIAGIGQLFDSFYDVEATLRNFSDTQEGGQFSCQSALLSLKGVGQYLLFFILIFLSFMMSFKVAVIEGLHVKHIDEINDGLINSLHKIFGNMLLAAGNIIASVVETLPIIAAMSFLSLNLPLKVFLFSLVILLMGLTNVFVRGLYWQLSMKQGVSALHRWSEQIKQAFHKKELAAHISDDATVSATVSLVP